MAFKTLLPGDIEDISQDLAQQTGNAYQDIATTQTNQDPVDFTDYNAGKVGDTLGQNVAIPQGEGYFQTAANQIGSQVEDLPVQDGLTMAQQTGQSIGTQLGGMADVPGGKSYLEGAGATVAEQMAQLLGSDSQYIKQAQANAMDQAQGRGLLNSSIASHAGTRAAIESAMPIAQQDAKTFSDFLGRKQQLDYGIKSAQAEGIISGTQSLMQGQQAGMDTLSQIQADAISKGGMDMLSQQQLADTNLQTIQAEAIVSGEMIEQKATIAQTQQNLNNAFQSQLQGAGAQTQVLLEGAKATFNEGLLGMEQEFNMQVKTMELSAAQEQVFTEASANIMQNYMVSIENMMQDPDFLDLGTAAVNKAFTAMANLASNSIKFVGASAGLPVTGTGGFGYLVDNYIRLQTPVR